MGNPSITYQPREDTTAETELNTLASVFGFLRDCHARKKGARPGAPEDPERRSDEIRAKTSIP